MTAIKILLIFSILVFNLMWQSLIITGSGARARRSYASTITEVSEAKLIQALGVGDYTLAQKILTAGLPLDLNAKNLAGDTALSLAAKSNNSQSVALMQRLLAMGAAVDLSNSQKQTPLLLAIRSPRSNRSDKVRLLLAHGANLYAKNINNQTALMLAAAIADPHLMRLLLRAGVAVGVEDAQDNRGYTALMHAIDSSNFDFDAAIETAELLIAAGVNVDLINNTDETALDLIQRYQEEDHTGAQDDIRYQEMIYLLATAI